MGANLLKKLYRLFKIRIFNFKSQKISPEVSIVFLTRNNKMLLQYSLQKLLEIKDKIDKINEIVVLDQGSIDGTMEAAQDLAQSCSLIKIVDISSRSILSNVYDLLRFYTTGKVILYIDLFRISLENPNVHIPDLFKPLKAALQNDRVQIDERIDGVKLLYFDEVEREKNSYILKEYIAETMSNIRMRIEVYNKKYISKNEEQLMEQDQILKYIDDSIYKLTIMMRLFGVVKYASNSLDENICTIFKDYSLSHNVTINHRLIGKPVPLDSYISNLVLRILQNMLYVIVQHNISPEIETVTRYSSGCFSMYIKYWGMENEDLVNDSGNKLGYYVLQSIQNSLTLIGGKMRIYSKPGDMTKIFIQIPFSSGANGDRGAAK